MINIINGFEWREWDWMWTGERCDLDAGRWRPSPIDGVVEIHQQRGVERSIHASIEREYIDPVPITSYPRGERKQERKKERKKKREREKKNWKCYR